MTMIQRNWDLCTLLIEMQNGIAHEENRQFLSNLNTE